MSKIVVVMPALNAEATLERTIADLPPGFADEIILVDDASRDRTVPIAQRLGLRVIRHDRTQGYGANQKTCYRAALERDADVVVMIHPDYQYDSKIAPYLVRFITDGYFDIMLGSRIRTRAEAMAGGMPVYKYLANRILTATENILLGQNLSEYHTGYRAYSRKVLTIIPWEKNADGFVFDSQLLLQAIYFGFKIGELPVPVRYMEEASSIGFLRSTEYGLRTLLEVFKYHLQKRRVARYPLYELKVPAGPAAGE